MGYGMRCGVMGFALSFHGLCWGIAGVQSGKAADPETSRASGSRGTAELVSERSMSRAVFEPSIRAGVEASGKGNFYRRRQETYGPGIHFHEVNSQGGQGAWRRTQARLTRPKANGSAAWECLTNAAKCSLPMHSGGDFKVDLPTTSVAFAFPNAASVSPVPETEQSIVYPDVEKGTDLRTATTKGGFSINAIYRERESVRPFTFVLKTSLLPRSNAKIGDRVTTIAGGLLLGENTEGTWKDIAFLTPPRLFGANKVPIEVSTLVQKVPGGLRLTYLPDTSRMTTATVPITLDPQLVIVSPDAPTIFRHGITYLIDGPLVISTPQTVTFESGAMLKFRSAEGDSGIYFTGSVKDVRVNGEPGDYVYFTSAADDSIGMDTDDNSNPKTPAGAYDTFPSAGDHPFQLTFQPQVENSLMLINHAKMRYAAQPVRCYCDVSTALNSSLVIANSILRDYDFAGASYYKGIGSGSFAAINNLMVGNHTSPYFSYLPYGLIFTDAPSGATNAASNFYAVNNTIVQTPMCIYADSQSAYKDCVIYNNILDCSYPSPIGIDFNFCVWLWPSTSQTGEVRRIGPNYFTGYGWRGPVHWDESGSPPDIRSGLVLSQNENGSYYQHNYSSTVNSGDSAGPVDFSDWNVNSECNLAGLFDISKTTTAGPAFPASNYSFSSPHNRRIVDEEITASREWDPIDRDDNEDPDMGYHYDPVDYIVRGTVANSAMQVSGPVQMTAGELVIRPGVTVAFSDSPDSPGEHVEVGLKFVGGARLNAQGTGPRPVRFTSTLLSGDRIGNEHAAASNQSSSFTSNDLPVIGLNALYGTGLDLHQGSSGQSVDHVCRFFECRGAQTGIAMPDDIPATTWQTLPPHIESGRLIDNQVGMSLTGRAGIARNLLLINNYHAGLRLTRASLGRETKVQYCTFDNNGVGIHLADGSGYGSGDISQCIFTENQIGIWGPNGGSQIHDNFFRIAEGSSQLTWYPTTLISGSGNVTLDSEDPLYCGSTDAYFASLPKITNRYHLDPESSALDNGPSEDPAQPAFMCTDADSNILDYGKADAGYHYPIPGVVGPSRTGRYFVTEDNEAFVPVGTSAAMNGRVHSIFFSQRNADLDDHMADLSAHGFNVMRCIPEFFSNYPHLHWDTCVPAPAPTRPMDT